MCESTPRLSHLMTNPHLIPNSLILYLHLLALVNVNLGGNWAILHWFVIKKAVKM